ncbi:ATP-dependent DNA helicase RecG [Candidatus Gracilibacteria bacterium]|nr:ATP-dependent DNA helicase RecG [Candidatus Gracilibacteria bacterium]
MQLTKTLLHTTDSYIKKLAQAGINEVKDLINHYPRTYENKSQVLEYFSFVSIKEKNSVICTIETMILERTRNNKQLIKAILKDKNDFMAEAVWFNQKYLLNQFKQGDKIIIYGKPTYNYGKLSFSSPEINFYGKETKAIKPIYPESNYIPSEWFEKKIALLKPYFSEIENILPAQILAKKGFKNKSVNLLKIHFPESEKDFEQARRELAYEELYEMQLRGLLKKKELEKTSLNLSPKVKLNPELVKEIISHLPYNLTNNQKIVIFQILKDMEKDFGMKRLLQGDVGTGKTIVALIAAIHLIKEGNYQVAFMVPTEILARQHFASIAYLLEKYDIKSDLLIGSLTSKQKDEAKQKLKSGATQFIVGTHALIQDGVHFKNLGFVIIDEQHRFGVEQRKYLEEYYSGSKEKGIFPHNLNMTATPIPRSLTLTIYGDQDISVLSEYPVGRKPIFTRVVKEDQREQMYRFIEEELKSGRQVYWISPLVEESEKLDIANATQMRENLVYIFPDYNVGLLHGKMKPKEKEEIMQEFMENKIQILSSTSVVEVGVDNPNATIICIEAAERFGLSQLHQFRGRVGRGEDQSYCYLFTTKTYKGERLKAMEKTNDGFELSEIDLELRGPGEVYGVRQSGIPDFKIASLSDFELISEIREDIENMLDNPNK